MERTQPSLLTIVVVMFCPPFMWGIGNVITRSLLIEGVNEIFLVTIRITLISILIGSYCLLFKRDKFNAKLLNELLDLSAEGLDYNVYKINSFEKKY